MTPAEIAVWAGIVAGGVGIVGGFFASLKFVQGVGGEKQEYKDKYRELRDDVDALQEVTPFCITRKQCEKEHKDFREAVARQIEIQVHNGLGEVKEQLGDINGTLCYFMGQMNINPPDNPKRRRRGDTSIPPIL